MLVDVSGDDADGRATRALLDAVTGDVAVRRAHPDDAPSAAVRSAAADADTDLVVVLDATTTVRGPWLDALIERSRAERAATTWTLGSAVRPDGASAPGALLLRRADVAGRTPDAVPTAVDDAARRPRVLLVPNAYAPSSRGGVETYVALLASALQRQGREVLVLHPHRDRSRPDYEVERDVVEGVPVVRVNRPVNLWHQEHGDERFERLFADLVREERIDVVHFHHLCDGLSPSLVQVARGAGAATAVTLHDGYTTCAKGHAVDADGRPCSGATSLAKCVSCVVRSSTELAPTAETRIALRDRAMEACLRGADLVTAPSRYIADLTAAAPWSTGIEVRVRPLGLDVDALGARVAAAPRAPGERLRVVVLGNVRTHPSGTDTKGGRLVAAAARALPGVDVAVHGSTDAAFDAALSGLPNLTAHGPYLPSQRGDLLRSAHVLVVASPVESFCFVAREALAVGVPVVSSDGGALPEAVRHETDGLLFAAGDAASLVSALARLDGDDALRVRLAAAEVPLLGIDEDAAGWATTYDELAAVNAAAPAAGEPSISVVLAATGPALARCAEALDAQTLPASAVEVLAVDTAGSPDDTAGQPVWAAAAHRARGRLVLVLDGTLVPSPQLLAEHVAGHAAAAGAETAVVGPTGGVTAVLHDPAARAWLRAVDADPDATGARADGTAPASRAVPGVASLPREVLLDLLDAGACVHPGLFAAALEQRGVRVHHQRRALLVAESVPDEGVRRGSQRARGALAGQLAVLAPELAPLFAVDDLAGRLAHVEAREQLASSVVSQLGGSPLSQLRAVPAAVDGGDQVPADQLLAWALDLLLERERLLGAAASAPPAVTRSA